MLAQKLIIISMMNYLKKKKNSLKNIFLIKTLLIIILSAVVFSGCKKTEGVGLDVIADPEDALNVGFFDGFRLTTYSTPVDSVATKNTTVVMLGSMLDPVFGTTTTGFYTQLRLSNNSIEFGDNAVCDSIVMSLDYTGFYGDSLTTQHITVYEIDESFIKDTAYYSNSQLALKNPPIFDQDLNFNMKDSVDIFGIKIRPHLRLGLDKTFGEKILDKSGSTELSNNEEFAKFIKGIRVASQEITFNGGHAYFNLLSGLSAITLYYHNDEDTTYEVFVINGNCDRFTTFDHHNYNTASPEVVSQLVNGDTIGGQQQFFLQGMASARGNIKISNLDSIVNQGTQAIHMAELIVNIAPESAKYLKPGQLTLAGIDPDGKNVYLIETAEGSAFLGGTYNKNDNNYVFNITRTMQSLFLKDNDIVGFRLVINGEAANARRLILNGGSSAKDKIRLKVFYTKID